MSANDFKELYEVLKKFYSNVLKESYERRQQSDRVNKFLVELGLLVDKRNKLKLDFEKDLQDKGEDEIEFAKTYLKKLDSLFATTRTVLLDRKQEIVDKSDATTNNLIMTEKFDLRTASSLLPLMDGTEDTTKQLIDAIELYSEMLTDDGKKLLINYVLKARLSQSAKKYA